MLLSLWDIIYRYFCLSIGNKFHHHTALLSSLMISCAFESFVTSRNMFLQFMVYVTSVFYKRPNCDKKMELSTNSNWYGQNYTSIKFQPCIWIGANWFFPMNSWAWCLGILLIILSSWILYSWKIHSCIGNPRLFFLLNSAVVVVMATKI